MKKTSLIIFILLFINTSSFGISSKQCLDSNFLLNLNASWGPFDFLSMKVEIEKQLCEVKLSYYKLLPKKYIFDVCKKPIHLTYKSLVGRKSFKLKNGCDSNLSKNKREEGCIIYQELKESILEEIMIISKGLRYNIESDHGKLHCINVLFENYFENKIIFNPNTNYTIFPEEIENLKQVQKAINQEQLPIPSNNEKSIKGPKIDFLRDDSINTPVNEETKLLNKQDLHEEPFEVDEQKDKF